MRISEEWVKRAEGGNGGGSLLGLDPEMVCRPRGRI